MNWNYYILALWLIFGCVVARECRTKKRIQSESNPILISAAIYHDQFCEGWLFSSVEIEDQIDELQLHRTWAKACRKEGPKETLWQCAGYHRKIQAGILSRKYIGNPSTSSLQWSERQAQIHANYANELEKIARML